MNKSDWKGGQRVWPSFARGVTHALVLAAVGVLVAISSVSAFASEVTSVRDLVPMVVEMPQSPTDLELKVGDTVFVDDGALKVTLLAITEDSRCPKDVTCVWSGRAVVALHVELDGADRGGRTATLMPGSEGKPDLAATVDRYVLALTDLQPYPERSNPGPTGASVAKLHVATMP